MLLSLIRYSIRRDTSNMFRSRITAMELLKKRVDEKSKKSTAPMNNADITIIGNDHLGFKPNILVYSEGNSYLFNCCSGTQRLSFMSKIRLHRCENVFVTNRIWDNISGIFGLSLTLQDMGVPTLNVNSTEGITGLFEATKDFVWFNTGMVCTSQEAKEYKDACIHIVPIHLDAVHKKGSPMNGDGSDTDSDKKTKLDARLVSYLCTLPDLPGALDPQKCRELKVPVGPLLAKLKSGSDVTLADGRVIKSVEVCSPKIRGLSFLIVECPEKNQIKLLDSNDELNVARNQRLQKDGRQVDFVIHLTPARITQDPSYQEWMQGFSEDCKHFLVSNNEPKVANFIECYRFAYLLNFLDNRIFPLLYLPENLHNKPKAELMTTPMAKISDSDAEFVDEIDEGINPALRLIGELDQLEKVTKLNSLDKISLRPKKILETVDAENNLDILVKEAEMNPHYQEELDKLRQLQSSLPEAKDYEPQLVFLGTGSAIPAKQRNTSGILINFTYPRNASVIMDCGEDTYGQLMRHYGPKRAGKILKQLDLIYVSHQHTDHHVGLIDLLRHRKKYTSKPVVLLLPMSIEGIIEFHDNNFQDLKDTYKIYRTKHLQSKPKMGPDVISTVNIKNTIYENLQGLVDRIDIVGVEHCANSMAVVMHFNIGHPEMKKFSIAYSGDARPSDEFAILGKDCDLLIHEATFDDRSMQDALYKKHSTSSEAIKMGKSMNAKFTILTHFSQRIPKIPYFTEDFDDKVGFAFDNLSLSCPTHFCRLPLMKPMLALVFKKSLDDIDLKYLKAEIRSRVIDEALKSKKRKCDDTK